LPLARTKRTRRASGKLGARRRLGGRVGGRPGGGQAEHLVQRRARERLALGGRLHLHKAAVAGHDDVRVDLGRRVLLVVEVEQQAPVGHADRHRGDRVEQRQLRESVQLL
jgi:hypothetical protein